MLKALGSIPSTGVGIGSGGSSRAKKKIKLFKTNSKCIVVLGHLLNIHLWNILDTLLYCL
jgi:hypothetical protein